MFLISLVDYEAIGSAWGNNSDLCPQICVVKVPLLHSPYQCSLSTLVEFYRRSELVEWIYITRWIYDIALYDRVESQKMASYMLERLSTNSPLAQKNLPTSATQSGAEGLGDCFLENHWPSVHTRKWENTGFHSHWRMAIIEKNHSTLRSQDGQTKRSSVFPHFIWVFTQKFFTYSAGEFLLPQVSLLGNNFKD